MTGEELTTQTVETGTETLLADTPLDTSEKDMGDVFDRLVTNNGANRGEGGKFVSPNGEKAPAEGDGEGTGEVVTPPVAATPVPAHLPQSTKDIWEKLPPEGQAEIARLTGEWDRKFGQLGEQLRTVKPIADRLTEATTKFPQFANMTPERLAQGALELAAVQAALETPGQAVPTIIEIAKTYKVLPQLAQVLRQQNGEGQAQGGDAQLIAGLQEKISNLEAQLRSASDPNKVRETVSTAFLERETEAMVQRFAANEGKDYWAEVEADMPHFIQIVMGRGLATDPQGILQSAYDMAINANPGVRAKLRAAEAEKATAANADPQRAEAVRKAVSINVKSRSNGKDRTMTEEEAMASAYDRAMAS